MKASTQILSRQENDLEYSILIAENLYTVTYEGTQICLKQQTPGRDTPTYRLFIYSNSNIAAKKMRQLNKQYQTTGFRVEKIDATKEIEREHIINDMSSELTTFIKTEKGWIEQ